MDNIKKSTKIWIYLQVLPNLFGNIFCFTNATKTINTNPTEDYNNINKDWGFLYNDFDVANRKLSTKDGHS